MLDIGKVSYRNFSMQLLELVCKKGSDHLFNIILIIYTTRTFLDCTICGFFRYFRSDKPKGGRTIAPQNNIPTLLYSPWEKY